MVREDNDSAVFTATSGPDNDLDAWARRLVGNDPERLRYPVVREPAKAA